MGTTAIGSTLYVFDIDLDRGKQFPLSSTPHNEYKNLNGAENIFVKDGYLYCAYESAADGVTVLPTGGDKTDVIWKMRLGRDTIIDNRVYYGDSSYTTFTNSLENYINSTSSSTYSPDLARMLMTFSSSAYDKENLLSSLKNCGFKSASIEISENYDKKLEDEVGFAIASKTLSDGTKLVFIPVRGTEGAMEWASDIDVATTFDGFHKGFANAMKAVYSELEQYFFGSIPTTNVKYVLTGHSRGAAVSNLLAWKLIQEGVSQSNIYSYNFACPDTVCVTDSEQEPDSIKCIFNINNANDLVSYIPGIFCSIVGSWDKFGKSYWFKEDGNSTKVDIGFSAHSNAGYTNFMDNKKSISEYMTFSQVKDWMESDKSVWESIKSWMFVGVYCPVSVEIVDVNGNVVATVIDGELQGTVKEGSMVFFRTDGDNKKFIFPENKKYTVRIIGTDNGVMRCRTENLYSFAEETDGTYYYDNISVVPNKIFTVRMYNDPYWGELYVCDSNGKITDKVGYHGTETPYLSENKFLLNHIDTTVDYLTYVIIDVRTIDVPQNYHVNIYINDILDKTISLAGDSNQRHAYYYLGNITENIKVSVKFEDENGNYLKDLNGNEITEEIAMIKCNSGFFIKLIAFFKKLFGTLPNKVLQ